MTASHLDLHLLFTVADSLAAATADLALIAARANDSPLLVDVLVLLDAVDAQADALEAVIARRASRL
jgi:hypothetical protein